MKWDLEEAFILFQCFGSSKFNPEVIRTTFEVSILKLALPLPSISQL